MINMGAQSIPNLLPRCNNNNNPCIIHLRHNNTLQCLSKGTPLRTASSNSSITRVWVHSQTCSCPIRKLNNNIKCNNTRANISNNR